MDKPSDSEIPDFCLTGLKDPPIPIEVSDGSEAQDKLPAQLFNWLSNKNGLWIRWIAEGILQRSSLSDKSPIMATSDRDGNIRSYLTPEGYVFGPVIQEQFRFNSIGAKSVLDTLCSSDELVLGQKDAGTSVSVSASTGSSTPSLLMTVNLGTGVVGAMASQDSTPEILEVEDTVVVIEGRVKWSAVGNAEFFWGLNDRNGVATASQLFGSSVRSSMFHTLGGADTKLYVITSDGSGVQLTDTGEVVANDTWYVLRLEYHGVNSVIGTDEGSAVLRCFVDGVLVLTKLTGAGERVPSDGALGVVVAVNRLVTAPSSSTVSCGTIKLGWNECISATPPA